MRNARFWVCWRDGWVKLTLRPNQTLELHSGGPTDEGYSCTSEVYTHEGDCVRVEYSTWGRDCDGRHEWNCECVCPLDSLQADVVEGSAIRLPVWERERSGQRDYTAEAAGY